MWHPLAPLWGGVVSLHGAVMKVLILHLAPPLILPRQGRGGVSHYCQVGVEVQAPYVSSDTLGVAERHVWRGPCYQPMVGMLSPGSLLGLL